MIPSTLMLIGDMKNVVWIKDLTVEDGMPDPEANSVIETGYIPETTTLVWRKKKPLGTLNGQSIWIVHVQKPEDIEQAMDKKSKILTWKQAKLDKAKNRIDFNEEELTIIFGGGTPEHLEWTSETVDLNDPIVEKKKDKDGLITDVKKSVKALEDEQ